MFSEPYPQHPKYLRKEVLGLKDPANSGLLKPKGRRSGGLCASGCPGVMRQA